MGNAAAPLSEKHAPSMLVAPPPFELAWLRMNTVARPLTRARRFTLASVSVWLTLTQILRVVGRQLSGYEWWLDTVYSHAMLEPETAIGAGLPSFCSPTLMLH